MRREDLLSSDTLQFLDKNTHFAYNTVFGKNTLKKQSSRSVVLPTQPASPGEPLMHLLV